MRKRLQIFKAGSHTDSRGQKLEFSEADIAEKLQSKALPPLQRMLTEVKKGGTPDPVEMGICYQKLDDVLAETAKETLGDSASREEVAAFKKDLLKESFIALYKDTSIEEVGQLLNHWPAESLKELAEGKPFHPPSDRTYE